MTAPRLSCPYCNSTIPATDSLKPGQRVYCPRCHELVLVPSEASEVGSGKPKGFAGETSWAGQAEEVERFTPRRSNASLAGTILGVMISMAAIGLAFAWYTTDQRRKHDHPDATAAAGLQRVVAIRPDRLPALAYMPSDVGLLAGIRVAELMADEAGRDLLVQLRTHPFFRLGELEQRTGLKLEDIDHVVIGVKIEPSLPPPVVLAVRTREPYDAENVRAALKARSTEPRGGRALGRFPIGDNAFSAVLWCADERTLVMSTQAQELSAAPFSPSTDENSYASRFAPALKKYLQSDMIEGTQAWIVGTTEKLQKTLDVLPLIQIPGEVRKNLAMITSLAAWIQLDEKITWHAAIDCVDANAAVSLDQYLGARGLSNGRAMHLFGDRPETQLLDSELSKSLVRKREGDRVGLQAQTSLESLHQALGLAP
jgi:hypothetical protein